MTLKIFTSRQAEADLEEIALYIAHDNASAAQDLLARVQGKLQLLSRQPLIGEARDDLLPGCRSLTVGSYVMFYRSTSERLELIRVVHSARDVRKLFP